MNHFDAPNQSMEMAGLFSKIKKAVKKSVKSVVNVAKSVAHKPLDIKSHAKATEKSVKAIASSAESVARNISKAVLPKKVYEAVHKVANKLKASPVFQVAVLVAGSIFMGPAVAALLGQFGVIGSPALVKGMAAVGNKAISETLKRDQQKTIIKKSNAEYEKMVKESAAIESLSAQIAKDPEFVNIIKAMKAAGKTDDEIIKEWSKSKTANEFAVTQLSKMMLPEIKAQLVAEKVPAKEINSIAESMAKEQAAIAIENARKNIVDPTLAAASANKSPVAVMPSATQKGSMLLPLTLISSAFLLF